DRDAGAIAAATRNAARAGVAGDVELRVATVSAMEWAEPPGLVAVNPPYGVRVGESTALRNLYARLGDVLRAQRAGWSVAMLSADRALERQTRLAFGEKFRTTNGGIAVRLMTSVVPPASVLP
ncbi:MAG TPA: hypothetical protein VHV78_07435, partial [Gemmatimonadaceae bacterium]|nr:hypothetical protein [Gemmatimonadaceae bacterium]